MDIFAHALWTNLAFTKKYKVDIKSRLWAVFFGVMPDLVSFIPIIIFSPFFFARFNPQTYVNSQHWVFVWARESYNYTHSLVPFVVVLVVVLAIRKGKMYWPLWGWFIHIFIDIFTHPNFYSTPFLYPLSNFQNHWGVSWANPYFMIVNYGVMAVLYVLIFIFWRKNKATDAKT